MSTGEESKRGLWIRCFDKLLPFERGPLYDVDLIKEFSASDPQQGYTLFASMLSRRITETAGCFSGCAIGFLTVPLNPKISGLTRQGYSPVQSFVRVTVGRLGVCSVGFFVGGHIGSLETDPQRNLRLNFITGCKTDHLSHINPEYHYFVGLG